jgi:CheY-like chemotaxis protein
MSEINLNPAPRVVFIDDSATMREVIKVAFRRENMQVVACHDAASAFIQIEQNTPDVVITDVIMPDKDGYEVCQFIKQHPRLGKTPVILMSGVVNKSVADKAFAVKADELVRKPFQPQDLITRVKHLLHPNGNGAAGNGHVHPVRLRQRRVLQPAHPRVRQRPRRQATLQLRLTRIACASTFCG